MALSLVVGTNTLITEAEANDYLDGSQRAHCTWDKSGQNGKENTRLLVSAMRLLGRQCWLGTKTNPAQALPFPRDGLTDREGTALPVNTTPQEVKDAQAEWALFIKEDEDNEAKVEQGTNIKSVKAGSVKVTYFTGTTGRQERVPAHIFEIVEPYIVSSTVSDGAIATGVDAATSSFGGPYCVVRPVG